MLLKKETEHIFTVHYFKYNEFLSQGERLKVDTGCLAQSESSFISAYLKKSFAVFI